MNPSGAIFSPCRRWRYFLWRRWAPGLACAFIGLNPSTADETKDDNTIRRCIRFSRDWGFGAYWMLNLFAWRSTDPKGIYTGSPTGLQNDLYILHRCQRAGTVVLAWGNHGALQERGDRVFRMLRKAGIRTQCLGVNAGGQPKHPLYLPADAQLEPFVPF